MGLHSGFSDRSLDSLPSKRLQKDSRNRKLQGSKKGGNLGSSRKEKETEWDVHTADMKSIDRKKSTDRENHENDDIKTAVANKMATHTVDSSERFEEVITSKRPPAENYDSNRYTHCDDIIESMENENIKRGMYESSFSLDSIKQAVSYKTTSMSYVDKNKHDKENKNETHVRTRNRHHSETIVKEPCPEAREHEEYDEKRDLSKDEIVKELLMKILKYRKAGNNSKRKKRTNTADMVLHLVKVGIFSMEQLMAELDIISKANEQQDMRTQNDQNVENEVIIAENEKKEYDIKICCIEDEMEKGEKEDLMKPEHVPENSFSAENKLDKVQEEIRDQDDKVQDHELNDSKDDEVKNQLENVENNVENDIKSESIDFIEKDGDVSEKKSTKQHNFVETEIGYVVDQLKEEKDLHTVEIVIHKFTIEDSVSHPKPVYKTPKKKKGKKRHNKKAKNDTEEDQHIVDKAESKCTCRTMRKRRQYSRLSAGGYKGRGDDPSWNELSDSDTDRQNSRGSQKSDDQEETEKEKRGRREDDEKDRDENEESAADNRNHRNSEDRVSSALEKIANFKYRRKHGSLPEGQTQLTYILGLMLNETEEQKVPPDIFEQINLCLMTSMQVKSAGETTTCYICTHVSSLICHFGSCIMGYHQACSICMTLFKLIQKHVASCGLSDSFTSEVTCPVIICVKLKRAEIAAFDDAEKVWKKLKKNLARFANPDYGDDDAFSSVDSITMGRNMSIRHNRLSTVTRPILESIPESGGKMTLTNTRQKTGGKPVSRSEPIVRKNPDGSIHMLSTNLPKRFQLPDENGIVYQPSSLPHGRFRSVTLGPASRPVLQDIYTDSTDYSSTDNRDQETSPNIVHDSVFQSSAIEPVSFEARPRIPSDTASGSAPNSLPSGRDDSLENIYSIPGRVYGQEDRTTSLQHGRHQEIGERYRSLWDQPIGIPGIQDVVYGERSCLLHVARIWSNMKAENRIWQIHDTREEGVILPAYQDRLKILKMRYSKNFQWVRLSHLGSGTSGKCHLAMDFNTEFKFCIKKIHISKYEVNEVEIWSDLRHKNIVQLIGTLRRGQKIYLLSEFIDGGCLTETIMMQRKLDSRLSQWTALSYLKQILEALVYLEKKFVVHEDLKSDNILVRSGTKDVVIADFGVARKFTSENDIRGATPSGTQIVFSPEKARGQGHGYKSDLWSAICVLVHMLTGYPPWVRKYPRIGALLYVIIEQTPDIPSNVTTEVADLIRQGFNKDPSLRPGAEKLLQHQAFKILDGYTPDTFVSVLLSSIHNVNQSNITATRLPIEEGDEATQDDIVEEITNDLKSIHIPVAVESQVPTENEAAAVGNVVHAEVKDILYERIPQENIDMSEVRRDSNRNNSSIDMKKLALEYGISLPDDIAIKEEEPPSDLENQFLIDNGQITLNDQGLIEFESSTEKLSSDSGSTRSEFDFDFGPNSILPNFTLLLTEKERKQQKEAESVVDEYNDQFLIHQMSRSGSQISQSFESSSSSRLTSSDNIQDKIVTQLMINSKHSSKSSIEVPNLTLFQDSASMSSSEKVTIRASSDSTSQPFDDKNNEGKLLRSSSAPEDNVLNTAPSSLPPLELNRAKSSSSADVLRTAPSSLQPSDLNQVKSSSPGDNVLRTAPSSMSPSEIFRAKSSSPSITLSMYSIDEEDIDDNELFGSGEARPSNQSKSVDSGDTVLKKVGPIKTPNLFLDLSPATKRKTYAISNSKSDPSTADATLINQSPLPATQPYYTPQVQPPPPFPLLKSAKPKSTSGLGSSFGKSPPRAEIENDTSGAWSSPKSQQEEIEKYFEELSNTSGTDIHISQDIEEHHAKFGIGLDEDEEASMLYIQQQYLNNSPASNGASRLTVHYKNGENFTMEIPGLMVKKEWKEIIEKECSELIHNMGVNKFMLLDSYNKVLDLQKTPSQGEILVYVEEVEDTTAVPWYCEAGMIM